MHIFVLRYSKQHWYIQNQLNQLPYYWCTINSNKIDDNYVDYRWNNWAWWIFVSEMEPDSKTMISPSTQWWSFFFQEMVLRAHVFLRFFGLLLDTLNVEMFFFFKFVLIDCNGIFWMAIKALVALYDIVDLVHLYLYVWINARDNYWNWIDQQFERWWRWRLTSLENLNLQ